MNVGAIIDITSVAENFHTVEPSTDGPPIGLSAPERTKV